MHPDRLNSYRTKFMPSKEENEVVTVLENLFLSYGNNKEEASKNTKRILIEIFKLEEERLSVS